MDNLENYLYLLLLVIYIISRVMKARSKQGNSPVSGGNQHRNPQPISPQQKKQAKKAFSFDEILKEFEKNLSGEEFVEEPMVPVHEVKKEKPEEVVIEHAYKKRSSLDQYNQKAYSSEKPRAATSNPNADFLRNDNYSIKKDKISKYKEMLSNPQGIKDVVVLNEIFNRKYF